MHWVGGHWGGIGGIRGDLVCRERIRDMNISGLNGSCSS